MSGEEVSVKYLDIDSTYRNRNNYPNPYDFVIPYSFPNKGSTSLGFFDAVLDSSPYTGSPTLQPGQLVTEGTSLFTTSSTTTEIVLDSQDSPIDNFYINSTLQLEDQFRTVISYNGTTKICVVSQPFFSPPAPGTVYYIRKQQTYFDSDIAVYNFDPVSQTVDQLNLLTAAPSPVKDFYQGSYIRFTNGSHVGETTLITKYDPFGLLVAWDQQSNPGVNTFVSTTSEQGAEFTTESQGTINTITLNLTSFESVDANRTIRIRVRRGSGLSGTIIYNGDFPVTNGFTRSDYVFQFSGGTLIVPGQYYTLTVQDVTSGGISTGFINIFGIVPSGNFITYNTNVYPRMSLIVNESALSAWSQFSDTGASDYVDTSVEKGFRIIPVTTTTIQNVILTLISFETVSSGRTITLKIRDGAGVTGTILFQNNYLITNTSTTPTDTVINISGGPTLTSGQSYTITLVDITFGGTSTGYINLFGIVPDINNISYNSVVYPKLKASSNYEQTDILFVNNGSTTRQGTVIALSGDGTTLAVGAPLGNTVGCVYVYTRSGSSWSLQGTLIGTGSTIGPQGVQQGVSVAISSDGNTVAFGGNLDGNGTKQGATWVFTRTSGVWSQQGSKLFGSGGPNFGNLQGTSVALSGDGNTLAIGGPGDGVTFANGTVWVFTRTSGVWTQQSGPFYDNTQPGGRQGYCVSLSSNGNTLCYGGPHVGATGIQGNGWIITRSAGVWTQQAILSAMGGSSGNILLGLSCSLSDDGNTASVGAPADGANNGSVYVYTRSGTTWTQQARLVGSTLDIYQQGSSCCLSGDGNTLISGGPFANGSNIGVVFVFTRTGTSWSQLSKLTPTGYSNTDLFHGQSCSISRNSSYIAAGAGGNQSGIGSTWIYTNGEIYSQPSNPVISSLVSISSEQGFKFIPVFSGTITNVILSLSSFEALSSGRTVNIKIRNGGGIGGSVVYSGSFVIGNSTRGSDSLSLGSGTVINGNTYTLTIQDTTSGGAATGNLFLYGITPDVTYVTYNITTYPQLFISTAPSVTTFIQSSSPTISGDLSTVGDQGFFFSPVFTGRVSQITISLTSFGVLGYRTVDIKILTGSGLGGTQVYSATVTIINTTERTQYIINLPNPESLSLNQPYTLVFRDVTSGGTSTGNITVYGINQISPYNSYNTSVYPRFTLRVPSYIITISPPKPITGFLNNPMIVSNSLLAAGPSDSIEFNSQAHENATTLFQNGVQAHNAHYYKIGLKYLVIPNQILNVSRGGKLDNYPYVYVQIYNDGNRGALNVMASDNPNAALAVFKCPIDKNLYNRPGSFFTLKTPNKDQIVKFRPDQNIRITLTLPDGTIISNQLVDNMTPLFPNPLLQVNGLFTLLPVDKYDQIPNK